MPDPFDAEGAPGADDSQAPPQSPDVLSTLPVLEATLPGHGAALRPTDETIAASQSASAADPGQRNLDMAGPLGRVADYDLLAELGRGGMGVVYRARQRGLNRVVALKMVLAGGLASEAEVQRFHLEAEAAANLRHPGIVAVYEVGQSEGRHFYSMEYIEGTGLNELVRQNPLAAEVAARYVRDVARAMQYAHEGGILHRDLKPSNVLIDAAGAAKVADFGLAKRVDDQSQLTASGAAIGTPSYMPPEQARGDHDQISALSDVYSLGAVLYETITSRPPFRAATIVDTMFQVVHEEPAAPRLLNPKIPRDVETICLKCLEKQPARRYASAGELADDLDRYLRGEPIRARRTGLLERAWRWRRRNPALAAALLGIVLALTVGFAGVLWKWREADAQRELAMLKSEHLTETSDEMFSVIEDWLERIPEEERVRQEQLERVLRLHEQFLADAPTDPEARRQLAQSHGRVAGVRRLLKQNDLAADHRRKAIAEYERLAEEFPDAQEYRLAAAENAAWLGEALRENNRFSEAQTAYEQAIAGQERLVRLFPSQPDYASELARSHNNLGLTFAATERFDEADRAYVSGIEGAQARLARFPKHVELRRQLASCRNNRAMLLKLQGRASEAAEEYARAVEISRKLVRAEPKSQELRFEAATFLKNYANLLFVQRKHEPPISENALEDARLAYDEAIAVLRALADEYASIPAYRNELAKCLNGLGAVHLVARRYDEGAAVFQEAADRLAPLARQYPKRPEFHSALGMTYGNLAIAARRRGDSAQAQALLEQAIEQQQQALDSNPQDPEYRNFLRDHRKGLFRELLGQGRHAQAAEQASVLEKLAGDNGPELIAVAELFVKSRQAALEDASLSEDERRAAASGYEQQAIAALQSALRAAGANSAANRSALASNAALAPLQDNAAFRDLLAGR